jgi:hypothetical protein
MTDRRADAARLLSHLWAWLDDGLVELRPIGANGPVCGGRRWLAVDEAVEALPQLLDEYARKRWHAYYGVLPRSSRGGTAADVGEGAVVWVDLDTRPPGAPKHAMTRALADAARDEARRRLGRVPWKPSAVVLTGGGAHAYWRLAEPTPAAMCSELSLRLSAVLGGDPNACDVARILRLPGSLNHKYTPPFPVRLWHIDDDDQGLDPETLDAFLPPIAAAEKRRARSKRAPRRKYNPAGWAAEVEALRQVRDPKTREDGVDGRATRTFDLGFALGRLIAAKRRELLEAAIAAGHTREEAAKHLDRGILYGAGAFDDTE